jgi:N-acetylmuramoyl-L-alanine amidase
MKIKRTLLAALAMTTLFAVPTFAATGTPATSGATVANEPMASSAPAPAGFDPAQKKSAVHSTESIGIEANPVIVLDPGHGGSDPGGVGNGLQEKDLTLDIANRTKSYMNANYPASVYMTRTSDVYVSLDGRTTYANNLGASFFTSMHINSFSDASPNGLETYYYPGAADGQSLATNIYNKLKGSYSTLRGIKSADFYVLHYTYMAAALGETGFISNATDAANLKSATFKQNLAVQYAQGMHVYWWGY